MDFVLLITVVTVNLFLGGLVYRKSSSNKTNIYFAMMLLVIVLWSIITFYEEDVKSQQLVNLLVSSDFALAGLIGFCFFQFAKNFPRQQTKDQDKAKYFIIPAIIIIILSFTKLIVREVTFYQDGIRVESGSLYILYAVYLLAYILFGFITLFIKLRKATGIEKVQISYMFWGLGLTAIIAVTTNLILPQVMHVAKELSRVGIYSFLIFSSFTAYAIVRHRLLDIRAVISRSIIYFLLVLFVTAAFTGIILISTQLFSDVLGANTFLVSAGGALVVVLLLDPLKRWLSRTTDRVFFKARIDYQQVLQQVSEVINKEIELEPLLSRVSSTLSEGLKIKTAEVLMREDGHFSVLNTGVGQKQISLQNNSALVRYLRVKQHPSILESLERRIEDTTNEMERAELQRSRHDFESLGVALVVPVIAEGDLKAILALGAKLSGDSFSADELRLLNVIGPQVATAIEKAKLFGEVKDFSRTLEQKVEQATGELKQRNQSLEALQHVNTTMTRSLDMRAVNQSIVDSIANELGYMGAILIYLDKDNHLHPAAVTETPLTKRAIKMLPKDLYEYYTDLDEDNTLDAQAIKEQKMKIGTSLTDVFCPPVPRPIIAAMNKLLGVKAVLAIPLYSEGKIIGVIDVASKKGPEELTERDLEVLETIANQTGVVARNITLIDQLRQTNEQLEEANMHLQQLDQAKTEFVSIASHQLRTPMTGIMGYLSMMTQGDFGKVKPEHQKILVDLLAESQRMIRLINLFLNVSKIEAGKFEIELAPVQIEDLIQGEMKEVEKQAAEKKLKVVFVKPKQPLPKVMADPDKVKDVILNLLDNAIKYTAKGSVTASAEVLNDVEVVVRVKDTGIGIKPQDARELFNKFVRVSGIARIHPDGSGLGLFIAKKIVEAQRGHIWVESEGETKGSTFQFTIPIAKK